MFGIKKWIGFPECPEEIRLLEKPSYNQAISYLQNYHCKWTTAFFALSHLSWGGYPKENRVTETRVKAERPRKRKYNCHLQTKHIFNQDKQFCLTRFFLK